MEAVVYLLLILAALVIALYLVIGLCGGLIYAGLIGTRFLESLLRVDPDLNAVALWTVAGLIAGGAIGLYRAGTKYRAPQLKLIAVAAPAIIFTTLLFVALWKDNLRTIPSTPTLPVPHQQESIDPHRSSTMRLVVIQGPPRDNDPQLEAFYLRSQNGQWWPGRTGEPERSLGENIDSLSRFLIQANSFRDQTHDYHDYIVVIPPAVERDMTKRNIGTRSYDIAYVGPNMSTFHTFDGGVSWRQACTTDPYIIRLSHDFGFTGKRGDDLVRQVEADLNPVPSKVASVAMASYDWGTPPLKAPAAGRNEKPKLHWWLEKELKDNPALAGTLEGMAQAVQRQAGGVPVTIYEYAKRGDSLWVAGEVYSGSGKMKSGEDYATPRGFICHSSDGGRSWVRQWLSDNTQPEPVYGIYFSDADEGWGLTIQRVLHTKNGGNSWEQIFRCDEWCGVEDLFILGKTDLVVATKWGSGHLLYSSRNRGLSWEKASEPVARDDKALVDLLNSFGSDAHYGGVYSREAQDK